MRPAPLTCRVAALSLLLTLAACGGGGGGTNTGAAPAPAPPSVSPLSPPAPPPLTSDDARDALPGLNGVRARLTQPADWDASLCMGLTVYNRHPRAALQAWEAVVDLGAWDLRSTPGARADAPSPDTRFITVRADPLAASLPAGQAATAQVCVKPLAAPSRLPMLVRVASDLPPPSADPHESGLWRLVAANSRLTMNWLASGRFNLQPYSGHPDQQWRLTALGGAAYRFALASRDQCLGAASPAVPLVACTAAEGWTLETLAPRSDLRPGRFRLHRSDRECLRLHDAAAAALGPCDADADLHLEPVGYGEREAPVALELRGRLLVKPSTDVAVPRMTGRMAPDAIDAVQRAYREHLPVWFHRASEGRVKWVGDSVVASPMTAAVLEGGNWLPSAATMPADVQAHLPPGRYDSAAVFFLSGVDGAGVPVPGGWGWGPGASAASNGTLWVTVNGGAVPAAQWLSWQNEPMEVFVHEPMHGLDAYFDRLGVSLPEGYLHGGEQNLYTVNQHGWMPWYRDILLGRVIAADGTYRGYGPRAFQWGPPRLRVTSP